MNRRPPIRGRKRSFLEPLRRKKGGQLSNWGLPMTDKIKAPETFMKKLKKKQRKIARMSKQRNR